MKLSKDMFQKTKSWITRNARSLEMVRWEYLFENGSKEKVIRCLWAFQNEDGGFGHRQEGVPEQLDVQSQCRTCRA